MSNDIRTMTITEWRASGESVDLWSTREDTENLEHGTIEDAVQEYIDLGLDRPAAVYGWRRAEVSSDARDNIAEAVLDSVFELLDEDYGGPDGPSPAADEAQRSAARVFVDTILSTYRVWRCDAVVRVSIGVTA